MLAAVLADGETVITSAACEPEMVDLADCLNKMGAKVSGAGTPTINIQGVARLRGASHAVMPDRIETGTYAVAAAMAGGEVRLTRTRSDFIQALIDKMVEAGVEVTPHNDGLTICRNGSLLRAVEIETGVYPGFPTDLQAPFMALMTLAQGESVIKETIFENRLMHAPELRRMGAEIVVQGDSLSVLVSNEKECFAIAVQSRGIPDRSLLPVRSRDRCKPQTQRTLAGSLRLCRFRVLSY